jgi:hypothetical protein
MKDEASAAFHSSLIIPHSSFTFMSLPEISRRCLSCGAAVRAGARFCPHCGQPVGSEGGPPSAPGASEQRARVEADAPATRDADAPQAREAGPPSTREAGVPRAPAPPTRDVYVPSGEREASAGPAVAEGQAGVGPTAEGRDAGDGLSGGDGLLSAGGGLKGAGDAAAVADAAAVSGVERRGRVARAREATRERAARMREEALVALEETPDDSGLRFVVAAVVLFLLFAFLLFLSVTVLR